MRGDPVPTATRAADPYFFLSYAHAPRHGQGGSVDPDIWVVNFFRDLRRRVMDQGNLPPGTPVGILDREMWVNHDWCSGLPNALATSRVLVPLYSPRYFQSLHCGKEWSAFAPQPTRSGSPGHPAAIIPALWAPVEPDSLPEAARSVPLDDAGLASYAELGFDGMIKLSRYRVDYDKAVLKLAEGIVRAAERGTAGARPIFDYDTLPSAFGPRATPMRGDQTLQITIVAPCWGDLPPGRGHIQYGPDACDWNPYLGSTRRPIAEFAADLARSLGYRANVGNLREHQTELLASGSPTGPEVIVVDPWAVTQPECQRLLDRCNLADKPWVQVLIPWSNGDAESLASAGRLRLALDSALGSKLEKGRVTSAVARAGVPTLDEFGRVLERLILTATKHYLRHARVTLPDQRAVERPRLRGSAANRPEILERSGG